MNTEIIFKNVSIILGIVVDEKKNKQIKINIDKCCIGIQELFWINTIMFEHKIFIESVTKLNNEQYEITLFKY